MNRMPIPLSQENPLWISWHDTTWIPILNPGNVMDYFQEKSNPFYDRTCNNEMIKMQRVGIEQMNNMTGREYILLHVQEPILYVIRKQHRHSPNDVTPMADYYIIAGTVYQAPDLANVFNSRLLSVTQHLQSSFEETSGYSRYHPNKGYSWDFSSNKALVDKTKSQKKDTDKAKEEPSSFFQRKRVDMLLGELLNKFPLPMPPQNGQTGGQQPPAAGNGSAASAGGHSVGNSSNHTTAVPANSASSANAAANTTTSAATSVSMASPAMANGGAVSQSLATPTGADDGNMLQEIKQERMETSPEGMGGHHHSHDNGELGTSREPSDMKPPPEKKMKLN